MSRWFEPEPKKVGRKPKIYRIVYTKMFEDETTGQYYSKPVQINYAKLQSLGCHECQEWGREGICVETPRLSTYEEYEASGTCLICDEENFMFKIFDIDPKYDYLKWALTAEKNKEVAKQYESDLEKGFI